MQDVLNGSVDSVVEASAQALAVQGSSLTEQQREMEALKANFNEYELALFAKHEGNASLMEVIKKEKAAVVRGFIRTDDEANAFFTAWIQAALGGSAKCSEKKAKAVLGPAARIYSIEATKATHWAALVVTKETLGLCLERARAF